MGYCAKCGERIEYNRYTEIKGKYYCPKCVSLKEPVIDFSELAETIAKVIAPTITSKEECEKYGIDLKPKNIIKKRKRTYYYCTICKKRIGKKEFRARDGRCRSCWAQVGMP